LLLFIKVFSILSSIEKKKKNCGSKFHYAKIRLQLQFVNIIVDANETKIQITNSEMSLPAAAFRCNSFHLSESHYTFQYVLSFHPLIAAPTFNYRRKFGPYPLRLLRVSRFLLLLFGFTNLHFSYWGFG